MVTPGQAQRDKFLRVLTIELKLAYRIPEDRVRVKGQAPFQPSPNRVVVTTPGLSAKELESRATWCGARRCDALSPEEMVITF
jgi:hypothetical protein